MQVYYYIVLVLAPANRKKHALGGNLLSTPNSQMVCALTRLQFMPLMIYKSLLWETHFNRQSLQSITS